MAQYLKSEVRERIEAAALRIFARDGYQDARIGDIAAEAGISTGNIYRYYKNKEELFYAIIDRQFAARILKLTRSRVRALQGQMDIGRLEGSASAEAEALLEFWIANRLKVVVLFSRSEGSIYEDMAALFVHELTRLAVEAALKSDRNFGSIDLFLLRQIFENTLNILVAILYQYEEADDIRTATWRFWRFQLSGLRALLID